METYSHPLRLSQGIRRGWFAACSKHAKRMFQDCPITDFLCYTRALNERSFPEQFQFDALGQPGVCDIEAIVGERDLDCLVIADLPFENRL